MEYKINLTTTKKNADRRSDRDWIAYNKKMDAREKHQKKLIVKRNKELGITQKKVDGLSGGDRTTAVRGRLLDLGVSVACGVYRVSPMALTSTSYEHICNGIKCAHIPWPCIVLDQNKDVKTRTYKTKLADNMQQKHRT